MKARRVVPIAVFLAAALLTGPLAWARHNDFFESEFAGYEKQIARYYERLSDAHEEARKGDWRDFHKRLYEAERDLLAIPGHVKRHMPETRTFEDHYDHERFEGYFKYLAKHFNYLREARKQAEDRDWDDYRDEIRKADEAMDTARDYLHGRYVSQRRSGSFDVRVGTRSGVSFHLGTGHGFSLGIGLGRRPSHPPVIRRRSYPRHGPTRHDRNRHGGDRRDHDRHDGGRRRH